jgi:hypothetical protein
MAVTYNTVTVGNTATQILSANGARRTLIVYNNGTNTVYMGPDTNVTTSNGIPLPQQSSFSQNGEKMWKGAWYGITSTGTSDVRYIDFSE